MDPAYLSDHGTHVACSACGVWHVLPCEPDPPLPGDHVEVPTRCHTRAVVLADRYKEGWGYKEWERCDWLALSPEYAMDSTHKHEDMY